MWKDFNKAHKQKVAVHFSESATALVNQICDSIPSHIFTEMTGVTKSDTVLDVACGSGLMTCCFANYANHVTGIDVAEEKINRARINQKNFNLSKISWDNDEILPLPYADNSYSIVFTRNGLRHTKEPGELLNEMIRVCKPGGSVVVIDIALSSDKVHAFDKMLKLLDPLHVRTLTHLEFDSLLRQTTLHNIRQKVYQMEAELEAQLLNTNVNPDEAEKIRALVKNDVDVDNLGIGAHYRGDKVYFSIPMVIYNGQFQS